MNAFWISPYGEIRGIGITHIEDISAHPDIFGIPPQEIESIYKKYNEPLGLEGKAREEIMFNLIKEGWIRVRAYRNNWIAQCWQFTLDTFKNLKKWIRVSLRESIIHPYDEILVQDVKTNKVTKSSFEDVLESPMLKLAKKLKIVAYSTLKRIQK